MSSESSQVRNVVPFPVGKRSREKSRKSGINNNKEGSVRNVNGKVYVDFIYLGERVRESSGLPWNEKNAKEARGQLDKIIMKIKEETFRFAEVFPDSKHKELFSGLEAKLYGLKMTPEQVVFREYAWKWLTLREESGRVTGRTLREYRSYLKHYLVPFFGEKTFSQLNAHSIEEFVSWARKQELKKKPVSNKSINKYLVPMKMICKQAAIEYQWGSGFDPFFGFNRLPEEDAIEKIFPFSIEEQQKLREKLPDHWRPYFDFAFRTGLRPGEQIGLKPDDIDWDKGLLHVRRAITLDGQGKRIEGNAKNKYSRRTVKLTTAMRQALEAQRVIYRTTGGEYLFCTPKGCPVHLSNLRKKVWIPTLEAAEIPFREMKQTRHTFATMGLSYGENPLWIARVMGHRNTEMVVKVYSRYVENAKGTEDGAILTRIYEGMNGRQG